MTLLSTSLAVLTPSSRRLSPTFWRRRFRSGSVVASASAEIPASSRSYGCAGLSDGQPSSASNALGVSEAIAGMPRLNSMSELAST